MSGNILGQTKLMDAAVAARPESLGPKPHNKNAKSELQTLDCDILVIEDEVLMQALLNRYLGAYISQKSAYSKLKITTLSSGWDLLKADLSKVKVAIVDILLPQVTGVDLIRSFRAQYPDLGIVPISGMATEPMKRALRELLPKGMELLQKPLRKEEFLEAFEFAYNFKQPPGPSVLPKTEGDEQLWSTVESSYKRTEIPTVHRKLLRKKAA